MPWTLFAGSRAAWGLICSAQVLLGCGKTTSTPEEDESGGADVEPPPGNEGLNFPCSRDPIDPNGSAPFCGQNINDPSLSLRDGFEFVDYNEWFLARRGDEFRVFEFAACRVEEIELPEELKGRRIALTPLPRSDFGALLSCGAGTCEAWVEEPPLRARESPTLECPFGGLERKVSFPSDALEAFTQLEVGEGSDMVAEFCAWNSQELYCEFDGVQAHLDPDTPIETVHLESENPGCVRLDFFSRNNRLICSDGAGGWEPATPGPIPPTFTNDTDACETTAETFVEYGAFSVTMDGTVLSLGESGAMCVPLSNPLGPPLAVGTLVCACSVNPVVVTATQIFATYECKTCR